MKFYSGEHTVSFEDNVLEHFLRYRQFKYSDSEAGGQLFTKSNGDAISICRATGPRLLDTRGPVSFEPSRWLEQWDIKRLHWKGLSFIGDWHTHFQEKPKPSSTDLESMQDCFMKSEHSLEYFVLVIVGTKEFPEGLSVSLHDKEGHIFLNPVS